MFFTEKCGMNIRKKGRRGCELRQRRSLHSDQRRMFFALILSLQLFSLPLLIGKAACATRPLIPVHIRSAGSLRRWLRFLGGNRDRYNSSAAVARGDRQLAAAHHFEPLTDIVQGDMRLVIVSGVKVRPVVLDGDLAAAVRQARFDTDMQRIAVRVQAVLDGVFHKGLQRQRRHAKPRVRRIEFRKQIVLMLRLFHREIRLRMLQLVGKGNGIFARDGGEVLSQVFGEVQRDLLRPVRVLLAQVVNGRHRVVDEVRPHLQHHHARALTGDLPLLFGVLLHVILKDQTEHEHRKQRNTEYHK